MGISNWRSRRAARACLSATGMLTLLIYAVRSLRCSDTDHVSIGATGYVPPEVVARRMRKTVDMTTAVGVLGIGRVAIAADSAQIDLTTRVQGSITKVVSANGRIAALAGMSSFGNSRFMDALLGALHAAPSTNDVAETFLKIAGTELVLAYQALEVQHGLAVESFPVQLLVAGRTDGHLELTEWWTVIKDSKLTMEGRAHSQDLHRSKCVVIGVEAPIATRTEECRTTAGSHFIPIPLRWSQRSCRRSAEALVATVIRSEPSLPRPAALVGRLIVAGPVQVESLGMCHS